MYRRLSFAVIGGATLFSWSATLLSWSGTLLNDCAVA